MKLYFETLFDKTEVEIPVGGAILIEPRVTDEGNTGPFVIAYVGKITTDDGFISVDPLEGESSVSACFVPRHLSTEPIEEEKEVQA